jgi:hypothetical protein
MCIIKHSSRQTLRKNLFRKICHFFTSDKVLNLSFFKLGRPGKIWEVVLTHLSPFASQ